MMLKCRAERRQQTRAPGFAARVERSTRPTRHSLPATCLSMEVAKENKMTKAFGKPDRQSRLVRARVPRQGARHRAFFCSRLAMRCLAAALLGVFVANATAGGEEIWPQHTITIVVPYGVGGSTDLIARILAQHMQEDLGEPVVVENRAGGSGAIGSSFVAQAAPNGYTIGIGTLSTHVLNPLINSKLSFGGERGFQPISMLVQLPNLLIINPRIPAKTVPELIRYLKANDGKLNYGSPGIGTSSQLSVLMFELATGTHMTSVPFHSTADELNNMMNGSIDLVIDSMTTLWPQAQSGAVRALAVTSEQRVPGAPDLPTIGETLKGYSVSAWQGLFAPAGTPRPIVEKIAAEVKRVFERPDVVAQIKNVGGEPSPMTPDAFAAFVASERTKWKEVIKAANIHVD